MEISGEAVGGGDWREVGSEFELPASKNVDQTGEHSPHGEVGEDDPVRGACDVSTNFGIGYCEAKSRRPDKSHGDEGIRIADEPIC